MMIFDELDKIMRAYEEAIDQIIPQGMFLVARLDGRSFSRLTKEVCDFEAPFDVRFRDMMIETVKSLMDCGFRVVYGFTESDEISLLFHKDENAYGRKVRKYNSVLAGVASASFSLQLGRLVAMDCRIVPLPDIERVQDYFLWRQEDANRNALNAHCYWMLRKEGIDARKSTEILADKSVEYKREMLLKKDVDFEKLPSWQKYGMGIYWEDTEKTGFNPVTQTEVKTTRRILKVNTELPRREEYANMIAFFAK